MLSRSQDLQTPWQPCSAAGWNRGQVKHGFQVRLGKMLQNKAVSNLDQRVRYLRAKHVQWQRIELAHLPCMWACPTEIESLTVAKGDLLVCEGGEVGRSAIMKTEPPQQTIIQNALHRVRPYGNNEPRFLAYLLRHAATQEWFDVLCNRATIRHFTAEKFRELWMWLPPPTTQRALADYLDRETANLDSLMAAKQRLLEVLAERRQAVAARAVACGLDSRATFRDSGVGWLGPIPVGWNTERARWLFEERDERSGTGEEELLTVSHLTGVTPRSQKEVNMFKAATNEGYKICRTGDLVINTLWAWMGAMGVAYGDGIVSPAYNVYSPRASLDPRYLDALVRLPVFAQEVARHSKGVWSSRMRLYPEAFFAISFPVPPLIAQREIAARLAKETHRLDKLRIATQRTMALIKERRAALIAAAVTGRIKVEDVPCGSRRSG